MVAKGNLKMENSISVMIVEDNADYRGAVELALESESDIQLSSQFGTAEVAIRNLLGSADEKLPDVILLDVRLPGASGIESIPAIHAASPDSKILVLTQSDQEADVVRAISDGALGYLLKSATLDELITGIRNVHEEKPTLDPNVAKFIFDSFKQKHASIEDSPLSKRETDVLKLVAKGLVKKEIAVQLGIGYATVDTHIGRIYSKLQVNNAPSAINKAHILKLFPPEEG